VARLDSVRSFDRSRQGRDPDASGLRTNGSGEGRNVRTLAKDGEGFPPRPSVLAIAVEFVG